MIPRPRCVEKIDHAFSLHPVVALLGPRQCGKTTLARTIAEREPCTYLDLESPADLRQLSAPMTVLESLEGLVIIDEVQQEPDLFPLLRVLSDRPGRPARFLLLGSASPYLVRGVSESLAGRIGFVDLSGFTIEEVGASSRDKLWTRGGFPRSFLASNDDESMIWRDDFTRTFLERDIPQLGISIPAETLRRFWTMIAYSHGQVWNASSISRSLGISDNTARKYLDILAGAYMVRILPPWYENLRKRQVKAPKVYLRDSGILHTLLQLTDLPAIRRHPNLGSSWEGFVLEQIIGFLKTRDVYFWSTHAGAELDLFILSDGKRYGFECKYSDAPTRSKSMHAALGDLSLDHLWVMYPGSRAYPLDERISVVPIDSLPEFVGTGHVVPPVILS